MVDAEVGERSEGCAAHTPTESTNMEKGAPQPTRAQNFNLIEKFLLKIRGNLNLGGFRKCTPVLNELDGVLKAVETLRKMEEEQIQSVSPLEERMIALEKTVRKSLEAIPQKSSSMAVETVGKRSYASVVAPKMDKTAVRIRITGAQDMQPGELLSRAKEHIPGAYAVRKMRSNDTEVFVTSASQRDAALNMPQPESFKILRQDFPVEIPGVPLATKIQGGKNGNNSGLIQEMIGATKARIPGMRINRIKWLHDGKEHKWAQKNGHTRGTIILSLPTEDLQREVIKKGIVLNSMLFAAQLWSPRAQAKQCFNCSQWGHTQTGCQKPAQCGECAGAHQTKDCPKKSVSCCNCGKSHRAWQRKVCQTYQTYKASVERVRLELIARTNEMRNQSVTVIASPSPPTESEQEFTIVQSKKLTGLKRGPGRPRKETPLDQTKIGQVEDNMPRRLVTRSSSLMASQDPFDETSLTSSRL